MATGERERSYRRRGLAWAFYDAAGAAFPVTLLAAVLPLIRPSGEAPGAGWRTAGLLLAILLGAAAAPVLGALSDLTRRKKLLLALSAGAGVVCTGLLALVEGGKPPAAGLLWLAAGLGFGAALVLHEALLPHAARPADLETVSARGSALAFLGGALLLAGGALLRRAPGAWGPRLCLAGAALWWALLGIPLLAAVPEPRAPAGRSRDLLPAAFRRLGRTLAEIRLRREAFRFLLAGCLAAAGLGALARAALARARTLGLGHEELLPALLLAVLLGLASSLVFGTMAREGRGARRRSVLLALVLANLVLVPALGLLGTRFLPRSWTGAAPPPYAGQPGWAGQGLLSAGDPALLYLGSWSDEAVDARRLQERAERIHRVSQRAGDRLELPFHGQEVLLSYAAGPDFGIWHVELDGRPLAGEDGRPLILNCYSPVPRWELTRRLAAPSAGLHTLALYNNGEKDTRSTGTRLALGAVRVLEPQRRFRLPLVLALLLALEAACLGLAFLLGPLLGGPAGPVARGRLEARTGRALALLLCAAAAVCACLPDSVLGWWCLYWLACWALGGGRALGRSLFASLVPAPRSGELFGLYAGARRLAAVLGVPAFSGTALLLGSEKLGALGAAVLLLAGIAVLLRVRVEEGRAAAGAESEAARARGQ